MTKQQVWYTGTYPSMMKKNRFRTRVPTRLLSEQPCLVPGCPDNVASNNTSLICSDSSILVYLVLFCARLLVLAREQLFQRKIRSLSFCYEYFERKIKTQLTRKVYDRNFLETIHVRVFPRSKRVFPGSNDTTLSVVGLDV